MALDAATANASTAQKRSTHSISLRNAQASPFLHRIPPELRNRIYREVLLSEKPINLTPKSFTERRQTQRDLARTQLLSTCYQIREEASQIFWAENRLTITIQCEPFCNPCFDESDEGGHLNLHDSIAAEKYCEKSAADIIRETMALGVPTESFQVHATVLCNEGDSNVCGAHAQETFLDIGVYQVQLVDDLKLWRANKRGDPDARAIATLRSVRYEHKNNDKSWRHRRIWVLEMKVGEECRAFDDRGILSIS